LLFRTATYVEHHLLGLIFAVVAVYGIACGLAALAADRVYGRTLNLNQSSAWFDGFRTDLPEGGENSVVVTMKSKEVHRGWVFHYTADNGPIADRELVLTTEGNLDRFPGQHAADGKAQVILHGDAIESIELLYVPKPPSPQAGS